MISNNLQEIRKVISASVQRAGRSPQEIRMVAVTKTVGPDEIREAAALGLCDFGENRLQEAKPKVESFPDLNWHFIGHLQTNKAREVLAAFSLIHSLDRFSLAAALQRRAEQLDLTARCLVQLNISGEKSKYGLAEAELADFLEALRDFSRVQIEGFMTMAPFHADPAETRPVFRRLRELQKVHARPGMELKTLSMGMTNDYAVAVEEGATLLRIGTALFGERKE